MSEPDDGRRVFEGFLHPVAWFLTPILLVVLLSLAVTKLASALQIEEPPGWVFVWILAIIPVSWVAYPWLLRQRGGKIAGRLIGFAALWIIAGGLFCGIAIPNLLGTIDRGKQKRTMADMRAISNAIQADLSSHPQGRYLDGVGAVNRVLSLRLSERDGWNNKFILHWRGQHVLIRSYGMHGDADGSADDVYVPGQTMLFEDDIVLEDGQFTRYPMGMQQ